MNGTRFKLFGTWKNALTYKEALILAKEIINYVGPLHLPFELSICPPMIAIKAIIDLVPSWLPVTAQNAVWDDKVSFTGETTGEALHEIGCRYVILGHSERRLYLGEDNNIVAKKVLTAIKHALIPVICIGEFFYDYKNGRSEKVIEEQTNSVMDMLNKFDKVPKFIIAYEPAWAISTSKEALKCDPAEANLRHIQIREIIRSNFGSSTSEALTILYGGSVLPENASQYFNQSDIDGGLVGTASQSKESFIRLIESSLIAFEPKNKIKCS